MPGPFAGMRRHLAGPVAGLAALTALATARAQPAPAEIRLDLLPGGWTVGRPVPIAVAGGKVQFEVPTPPDSSAMIIVSSLAKGAGPFPIRLGAEAARSVSPPPLASDGPSRTPELLGPVEEPPPPPALALPPSQRIFFLMVRDGDVASASNYLPVRGLLRAVGQRVQVYVDSRDSGWVRDDLVRDVVSSFDEKIFPMAAGKIGVARDVDGDGRFTVLVTGWLARLGGGKLAVDGFVRGADLDPDLAAPFGNRCDMMYLNARVAPGPHLRTVLAHEYTHAVTATQKTFGGPDGGRWGPEEEGWLDEAMAHLAEDLHGFSRSNIDYRVSAFLSCPERYRLLVDDYYTSDLFRSHGNRGSTYLFLRWCADRFGDDLLGTLVRSPRRGVANLEAATGTPFAALYRQWSVALALNGLLPADEAGYRSLALCGELEGWPLAGPRMGQLRPGGPDDVWSATGTSSHFVRVTAAPTGAARITIAGPAEADLQVTVVALPPDLPKLELVVHAWKDPEGTIRARAKLLERGRAPVELVSLAWEPLVPAAEMRVGAPRRGGLDKAGITAHFGATSLPASSELAAGPIALEGVAPADGPLIFKALGTDSRGRRVSAWAEVIVSSQAPPPALASEAHLGPQAASHVP
jgi:hypothetical protein